MMVAHIPAGYLADRIGRKPLLVAAWVAGLLAAWIMALARTLPVFVTGMLFYGFTAFVSAPMNSYVTSARGKLSPVRCHDPGLGRLQFWSSPRSHFRRLDRQPLRPPDGLPGLGLHFHRLNGHPVFPAQTGTRTP